MFKNGTIVDINDVATIYNGGINTIHIYLHSMQIKSPQTFPNPIVVAYYNTSTELLEDMKRFMEEASK